MVEQQIVAIFIAVLVIGFGCYFLHDSYVQARTSNYLWCGKPSETLERQGWKVVSTADEAIEAVKNHEYTTIALNFSVGKGLMEYLDTHPHFGPSNTFFNVEGSNMRREVGDMIRKFNKKQEDRKDIGTYRDRNNYDLA